MRKQIRLVMHVPYAIVNDPYWDDLWELMVLRDAPSGISIWEGRVGLFAKDSGYGCEGTYRPLTDQEWERLRHGEVPWEE